MSVFPPPPDDNNNKNENAVFYFVLCGDSFFSSIFLIPFAHKTQYHVYNRVFEEAILHFMRSLHNQ